MGIYLLKNLLFKIVTNILLIQFIFYALHEYDGHCMYRPPVQKLMVVKAQKLDSVFQL